MKYLITLTISLIALYAFIKRSYRYASINDEVESMSAPLDYESDKYKEGNAWLAGIGRG